MLRIEPIDYFYRIYDENDKPHSALSFMKNRRPTEFAERVFNNYYRIVEDKETFVLHVEEGKKYYSIYYSNSENMPEDVLPLLDISQDESDRIKIESRKINRLARFNYIYEELKLRISTLIDHPDLIVQYLFLTSLVCVAAQNKMGKSDGDKIIYINNDECNRNPVPSTQNLHPGKVLLAQEEVSLSEDEVIKNKLLRDAVPDFFERYMYKAIKNDNLTKFKQGLEHGLDLYQKDKYGNYLLLHAAEFNSLNIIRYVAHTLKIDLNRFQPSLNKIHNSWILRSLDSGNIRSTQVLTGFGVNINYLYDGKSSLLHVLAAMPPKKEYLQRIREVIDLGADIDLLDSNGKSPVFVAGLKNNIAAMEIFLDRNCAIIMPANLQSRERNLLAECFTSSSLQTVEFLLQRGFDPYLNIRRFVTGEDIEKYDIPIINAIRRGDKSYMYLLVKHNIRFDKYPVFCSYLLYAAFRKVKVNMAFYLVKRGINFDKFYSEHKERFHQGKPREMLDSFSSTMAKWKKASDEYFKEENPVRVAFEKNVTYNVSDLEIPEFMEFFKEYELYKNNNMHKSFSEEHPYVMYLFVILGIYGLYLIIKQVTPFLSDMFFRENENLTHGKNKKINKRNATKKNDNGVENLPKLNEKTIEQLAMLEQLISLCEKEMKFIISKKDCLDLNEQANSFLARYKDFRLETASLKAQHELNNKISSLNRLCKKLIHQLMESEKHECIGDPGINRLFAIKADVEGMHEYIASSLSTLSEIQLKEIAGFNIVIERICHARNDINQLKREMIGLADEIVILISNLQNPDNNDSLNKASDSKIKYMPAKKIKINKKKQKPLGLFKDKPVLIENKSETKVVAKLKIKPKEVEVFNKKNSSIINTSHSMYYIDIREKIKLDERVVQAHSLMCIMENIINRNNTESCYGSDAALYCLYKASHLIASLTSDWYGYNTIIVYHQRRMYHLKNNLGHYTNAYLDNMDILKFLHVYFHIFNQPVSDLKKHGECRLIDADDLLTISPDILNETGLDSAIHFKTNQLYTCLNDIEYLCKKAELYCNRAHTLSMKEKFMHAGVLHAAMHGILLQLRTKLKIVERFDASLFDRINALMPSVIDFGDRIAHVFNDDVCSSDSKEDRLQYTWEDIPALSLLEAMKNIVDKRESIMFVIIDYMSEKKNATVFMDCKRLGM